MSDLIERQAAIDAISCNITVTGRQNAELVAQTIGRFVDRIKALPSTQPGRKRGKWINVYDRDVAFKRCSECGVYIEDVFFANDYEVNFCPNCGKGMRGEER